MTNQTKAIARLVGIKEKAVDAAEAAYTLARRATADAERARDRAAAAWLDLASEHGAVGFIADLADRDLQLRGLRRAADAAELQVGVVKRGEAAATAALIAAKIEHRRYETWLERKANAQSAEVHRLERLAEDEVTARKKRTGT